MRLGATRSKRNISEHQPAEKLREMAGELERELETVAARVSVAVSEASDAEARAIRAVRQDDDRAARAALLEQHAFVKELAELEADGNVLRSLLEEIREFLASPRP